MKWSYITKRGFKKWTNVCADIHYQQMITKEMFEITISIDWDNFCSFLFYIDDDDFSYFFHDSSRRPFKKVTT